jgi:hypothetical protein
VAQDATHKSLSNRPLLLAVAHAVSIATWLASVSALHFSYFNIYCSVGCWPHFIALKEGAVVWVKDTSLPPHLGCFWMSFLGVKTRWLPFVHGEGDHADHPFEVGVPLWIIVLLSGVVSVWLFVLRRRHDRRYRLGQCMKCGYDLRGLIERCPECGSSGTWGLEAQPSGEKDGNRKSGRH